MQFYGITLSPETARKFKEFLWSENIYFEGSGCYENIHIEFLTDCSFEEVINDFVRYANRETN